VTPDTIETQKRAAVEFLQFVVAGRIEEAYERHVDMGGMHHNPYFAAGFPALKQGIENHEKFPNKQLGVKQVLADGDLVAVHSHVLLREGESGIAVVHLFRFDGDRIVELWDIGQPMPADTLNSDGAF
jgi:predicted SnoaL-like aldol condensation-catalyzing enzyme